jgi:hypothetical protein
VLPALAVGIGLIRDYPARRVAVAAALVGLVIGSVISAVAFRQCPGALPGTICDFPEPPFREAVGGGVIFAIWYALASFVGSVGVRRIAKLS